MDIEGIQQQIEAGIDTGIGTMEEYHKNISDNVYSKLKEVEFIAPQVDTLRSVTDNAAGSVYGFARNVNEKSGSIARDVIGKLNL